MVIIKSLQDIRKIHESGKITNLVLSELESKIKPGITTSYLEKLAEDIINKNKGTPAFKNYRGFPYSICASKNAEAVHGFPDNIPLEEGDIISIDVGVCKDSFFSDAAFTVGVGSIKKELSKLLTTTKQCLYNAIDKCVENSRLGDISLEIQRTASKAGFKTLKKYGGHGVGRALHEDPYVPNQGGNGRGYLLKKGLVLALEPILSMGSDRAVIQNDYWTVIPEDGSYTAHFEHTIVIMEDGAHILTYNNSNL